MTPLENLLERARRTSTGCLISKYAVEDTGYARANLDGKGVPAHRLSWVLQRGPIPKGKLICHKCDNRACIEVEHLFVGSYGDNYRDAQSKDRHTRGTRVWMAKLDDDKVRWIRRVVGGGMPQSEVAFLLGLSKGCINFVVHRAAWKHVA